MMLPLPKMCELYLFNRRGELPNQIRNSNWVPDKQKLHSTNDIEIWHEPACGVSTNGEIVRESIFQKESDLQNQIIKNDRDNEFFLIIPSQASQNLCVNLASIYPRGCTGML